MRLVTALIVGAFVCGGVAHAQSAAPASKGYVEGVAQSAFGNVTSQSYGVEVGVTIAPKLQVFGEVGYTRDTASSNLGASAQLIAGFLSRTQSNVTFNAKQPVTFGLGGVSYLIPTSVKVQPYVLVGGGIAQVKKDVTFAIAGTDVTGSLPQYGAVLGTDSVRLRDEADVVCRGGGHVVRRVTR